MLSIINIIYYITDVIIITTYISKFIFSYDNTFILN